MSPDRTSMPWETYAVGIRTGLVEALHESMEQDPLKVLRKRFPVVEGRLITYGAEDDDEDDAIRRSDVSSKRGADYTAGDSIAGGAKIGDGDVGVGVGVEVKVTAPVASVKVVSQIVHSRPKFELTDILDGGHPDFTIEPPSEAMPCTPEPLKVRPFVSNVEILRITDSDSV